MESIALQVNLSASRLRGLFRKETGLPLAHFVKLLRLETAHQLLTTEFLTIKEVMAKTGIRDHSHFNRDFKLFYGVTPSQYCNQSKYFDRHALLNSLNEEVRQSL
ncbi:MAG: helix-turn-helix transcriptional regulator [Acidobacteria bacterium]|nr:helix-turn-helix transcriptional regulator [Acidobacteriota bacterium]